MDERYCQSCGMPLGATDEHLGSNADGSVNSDYCKYCYEKGAFTMECTMDEMINLCAPHMASAGSGMSEDDAKKKMHEFFPMLKRWKAA
jgi:hypothetical protein